MNYQEIQNLRKINPEAADAAAMAEADLDFAGWLQFEGAKDGARRWYDTAERTFKRVVRIINKE